jgi:hypothetical protein
MIQLAQVRGLLLLTLKDAERGSGVSAAKLSKAERGAVELNHAEQRALLGFYRARWQALHGDRKRSLETIS